MYELILVSRIFEICVFAVLVGFLWMMVVSPTFVAWRRWLSASFIVLCLGVSARQVVRISDGDPWSWWFAFVLLAAILAVAGFYVAWRDRER